jgi:hypothetical protein
MEENVCRYADSSKFREKEVAKDMQTAIIADLEPFQVSHSNSSNLMFVLAIRILGSCCECDWPRGSDDAKGNADRRISADDATAESAGASVEQKLGSRPLVAPG